MSLYCISLVTVCIISTVYTISSRHIHSRYHNHFLLIRHSASITDQSRTIANRTGSHSRPTALGGSDSVENLQCTCRTCNTFKDKMLPDTFFDRINEIYLYQMERKYGKKLKWKLANKLIKSVAQ